MTAKTTKSASLKDDRDAIEGTNSVHLVGTLNAVSVRHDAAGDESVTFRLTVVDSSGRRDSVECECGRRSIIARVQRMPVDTRVEVVGALRRSYWRTSSGLASRTFVEVANLRRP